jgi:lipoprotein-releasing system permease protein
MVYGKLTDLNNERYGIVLGQDLARLLRVRPGDKVNVMIPQGRATPAGIVPRMRAFTLTGVFSSGHYEFDSTMALINLEDGQTLFRQKGPTGLRVRVDDMNDAPLIAYELMQTLPPTYAVSDWSRQNRTWFAAVQVEKRMMSIILFLIVLVGAFGLVSSMVMTVTEKQSDIAILRTLGASPASIMSIFMIQGAIVGVVGVTVGVGLGLGLAYNLDVIVPAIESALGFQFLPKEIYFISSLPSDPRMSDIVPISIFSLVLSLLATVYPSWRAAKTKPAEALRYE